MSNKYFDIKDTLYNITEKYAEAIELLISVGFDNIKDENLRKSFGQSISLENALKLKKINVENFVEQLVERIEANNNGVSEASDKKDSVKIVGVLPCPVRVPLTENFESWVAEQNFDFNLDYELKAASVGIGWIKDALKEQSEDALPDLFMSAGFELFFDKDLFGKYKAKNIFEDITGIDHYNSDFHNTDIELMDPNKQYSIVGTVAAVIVVNHEELNGRKAPTSWEDILDEEFENSVSLPVMDLDLFNSILLNIYKNYGEEGIRKLGRSLKKSLHPSEMVKLQIKVSDKPAVTIMPYFFTKMLREDSPMVPVWPKDGAIISPIFMLSKKEKATQLKPIVDFFASKKVGEILSHDGRFPSVHPEVDNLLPKENKYMWLGWDFINEHDISALIRKCEEIFHNATKGVER